MLSNFYFNSITLQMTHKIGEYLPVSAEQIPYSGPWAECKGDDTAQTAENQQAAFDQQLMTMMQSQYSTQQSQLQYLQSKMQPMIDNPTGYTTAQLASMRTGATDANAEQYQDAQDALNNQITQQSGGSKLASVAGSTTEADAALLNAEAQTQAGSQEAITAQNANLQQQNYWNAVNALNGVAAQENPLGYANAATSGSSAVAGLSQAVTASNQSQLLGALGGIASGLGSAVGGKLAGCWIAASIYTHGWNDIRTWFLRLWLNTDAPAWFRNFYLRHGERIAKTPVRWAFFPIFEYVLGAY